MSVILLRASRLPGRNVFIFNKLRLPAHRFIARWRQAFATNPLPSVPMKPLHWDAINPITGTPFTGDDPNLF